MLSTTFVQYMFDGFNVVFTYFADFDQLNIDLSYGTQVSNLASQDYYLNFFALWYLSHGFSDSAVLWANFFDDLFVLNAFEIQFIDFISSYLNSVINIDVTYVDFPDYLYIYKSFIFDWSDDFSLLMKKTVTFLHNTEGVVTVPTIFVNMLFISLYVYIFASMYFSYYGKANSYDRLIDHDYLLASSTVEAEEEITSWDDMILGLIVLVFTFLWYFAVNTVMVSLHLPEYYLSLYVFPVIYYIIMLIPAFLAYDFGIYFVAYLRGKGDSTLSVVELMYDYIAFASFYIRLVVQNVRLLLMTFTFASFHEIILIHEVNKSFLFGDEWLVDPFKDETLSFLGLGFILLLQISTHIVYFFYELLHLLFVVTAQIIAFHAMVFWLFLFLYTMFSAELQERFFFQKRLHHKNLGNRYLSFKNSYFTK